MNAISRTVAHFFGQKPLDLLSPQVDDVDFYWIADRLSKIPRFLGGTSIPYSIAQHSLWVMDRVGREAQPYALLHDAPEAIFGDFYRPAIVAMDVHVAGLIPEAANCSLFSDALDALHQRFAKIIHEAAGLRATPPETIRQQVIDADNHAGDVEYRALVLEERMPGAPCWSTAARARDDFLSALQIICPNARGLS